LPEDTQLHRLYGQMEMGAQRAAIAPAPPGTRKIVLATAIAETSITIDGVTVVIDAGLARVPRFDARSGLMRLETVRVSKAGAEQRAGRAGRTAPGVAIRLWAQGATASLPDHPTPEALDSDLSRLILDVTAFGVRDVAALPFPDPLPVPHIEAAKSLLRDLGAIDEAGALTLKGKVMQTLALPAREAAMVADAETVADGVVRAELALVASERASGADAIDLENRLRQLRDNRWPRAKQIRALARRMAQSLPLRDKAEAKNETSSPGVALLTGFSDRIARARSDAPGRYQMASGRGAALPDNDRLSRHEWLVITDLTGSGADARIAAAAPVTLAEIEQALPEAFTVMTEMRFDPGVARLKARKKTMIGQITVSGAPMPVVAGDAAVAALCDAVKTHGLRLLPFDKAARNVQARMQWLHDRLGAPWPAMDDATLAQECAQWLSPWLSGQAGFDTLSAAQLKEALMARAGHDTARLLKRLAPSHITVPTGSRIALDYATDDDAPVLRVRVQELFGLATHPAIGDGTVPLILELLSPAGRPIQRTRDLPAFWAGSWADTRAQMRGRYPRHPWPENPLDAQATRRAKPRS
jgi:ATP-dependent helicase HrpB